MNSERVFSALSNPVRRQLLEHLIEGPRTPGRLARQFDLSRPAVSEHLRVLREAGLIEEKISGRERLYSLNAQPLALVSDWLRPFEIYWRKRLSALKGILEDPET